MGRRRSRGPDPPPRSSRPMRRGRRKVEVKEPVEDWQKEVEEEEPFEDSKEEAQEEGEDPKEAKVRRRRLGLPFLAGLSHAGFLSVRLKESGGDDLLLRVNRKSYRRAMVQLGQMGALHPANRLAAFLTGRAVPARPGASAAVTMATVPPAAPAIPSSLQSAWPGSPGVQPGHYYLYNTIGQASRTVTRRLVKLVPLSQVGRVGALDAPDGTPGPDKDSRTTAGNPAGPIQVVSVVPPPARPAPSAGTLLVSTNQSSRIIVNVPKVPLPTQTGLSGTHRNIRFAPSSGTHENISRYASSITELNIICVDNEPHVPTKEEHVGVAEMPEEKPSLVDLQRAENNVSFLLSSGPSDWSSDIKLEKDPCRTE